MEDLIEPVPAAAAPGKAKKAKTAGGGTIAGDLRPKRARIIPLDQ